MPYLKRINVVFYVYIVVYDKTFIFRLIMVNVEISYCMLNVINSIMYL